MPSAMRARRLIGRAFLPSSAWAARPLASGARLSLIVRRSARCLGVGCPSFGGQRSGGGGSGRRLAELGTGTDRTLPAKRVDVFSVAVRIQTARSAAKVNVAVPFAGLSRHEVAAPGSVDESQCRCRA
jgi:hypothetical protein